MKKICVALGVLFMAIASALADDNELVKTASSISTKSSGEISTDSIYWKYPGSVGLNVNQAYFNDYCMEGSGASVSADAFLNLNANYKKNRVKWDNCFAAKYGLIYSNEFEGDEIRKNIDEFGLYSKLGYKMAKYWYASALASLESQFTNSYKYELYDTYSKYPNPDNWPYVESDKRYESEKDTISAFFAPAAIKVSLGFDYVPNKYINFFISPLTARFTFCRLNELAPNNGMEMISEAVTEIDGGETKIIKEAEYKKSRSELGAYAILRSDFDITKNLHFLSSLEGFYAYNKAISVYTDDYTTWFDKHPELTEINALDGDNINEKTLMPEKVKMREPYDEKEESTYKGLYQKDNPGKELRELIHGWSFKWKLELMAKVTKYINVSARTQFKYDNSEMKTLRNRKNGMPSTDWQIWEAISLGIIYQF